MKIFRQQIKTDQFFKCRQGISISRVNLSALKNLKKKHDKEGNYNSQVKLCYSPIVTGI